MEELPYEELFLAKEKKPYKIGKYIAPVMIGVTTFAGIPDWDAPKNIPKHTEKQPGIVYAQKKSPKGIADLLKQMEAWAQDGVSVYVEDFKETKRISNWSYQQPAIDGLGNAILGDLTINLRAMGVKVTDNYNNADIVITGRCEEGLGGDGRTYITLKLGYTFRGEPVRGLIVDEYFDNLQYFEKMKKVTNDVYRHIDYIQTGGKLGAKNPTPLQIQDSGNDNLEEINLVLDPATKKLLDDPITRKPFEDMWKKEGKILKGYRLFKIKN